MRQCLYAMHAVQFQVQQDDVRFQRFDGIARAFDILELPDNLDIGFLVQHVLDTVPHDRVIVDDQGPDRMARLLQTLAPVLLIYFLKQRFIRIR